MVAAVVVKEGGAVVVVVVVVVVVAVPTSLPPSLMVSLRCINCQISNNVFKNLALETNDVGALYACK